MQNQGLAAKTALGLWGNGGACAEQLANRVRDLDGPNRNEILNLFMDNCILRNEDCVCTIEN